MSDIEQAVDANKHGQTYNLSYLRSYNALTISPVNYMHLNFEG